MFNTQVITSSDLLPPPPLTLAGVTSGTVQETENKLGQLAIANECQEGFLALVTHCQQKLRCIHLCLWRSEMVWPRGPSLVLEEAMCTKEIAINYLFPIQQGIHIIWHV
jgi:hypothetical protein